MAIQKREQVDVITAKIERRVNLSEAMLRAMGVEPELFLRVALNALVMNPTIGECTPDSVDKAILNTINAKLMPDGKESAIVPFNSSQGKIATFIPMIGGQVKLAYSATPGLTLRVRLVYAGDAWEYSEGMYAILKHTPSPTATHRDEDIIAGYAVANFPRSTVPMYEVMMRGDFDRHKAYSRASGQDSPWNKFYGQMCSKTVLRQLVKLLPQPAGLVMDVPPELATYELEAPVYDDLPSITSGRPVVTETANVDHDTGEIAETESNGQQPLVGASSPDSPTVDSQRRHPVLAMRNDIVWALCLIGGFFTGGAFGAGFGFAFETI